MVPTTLDLPTALDLLELEGVPGGFELLAREVIGRQPAAHAWSQAESMAYRVVWEAVERRIERRTGTRPHPPRESARSGL